MALRVLLRDYKTIYAAGRKDDWGVPNGGRLSVRYSKYALQGHSYLKQCSIDVSFPDLGTKEKNGPQLLSTSGLLAPSSVPSRLASQSSPYHLQALNSLICNPSV